ncbi:MAG: glycosyltransferase family 9 protein [Planctomycetota bacterium]|jgi:hypothetical protein
MTGKRQPSQSSILAVHGGALGDVILFGRLLSRLSGKVTLAAGGEKARLLAGLGVAAEALDFEALPIHEVFGDDPPEKCSLPRLLGSHERLISCFGSGNRKAELRLAAMCGACDAAFLPVRPPADFRGHLLELWSDLLGLPGALGDKIQPWQVPRAWKDEAEKNLQKIGVSPQEPCFVIHPGAGSAAKCWPLRDFVEIARRLAGGARRARVVFVLGPVELERWEAKAIEGLGEEFAVMAAASLAVLAGLLASAAGYLGNDSGVTHLAAAVGAPTTALFAHRRRLHFAPPGRSVGIIAAEEPADISTEKVIGALGKWPEVT